MKPLLVAALMSVSALTACSQGDPAEIAAVQMPALLNPNTASQAELVAVSGVDAVVAETIVEGRPYADAMAFNAHLATNMSNDAREDVLRGIFIPFDINTTPEDDFQIIPGVGGKMAHEFEEYRPYADMAQFDREIGKYVDAQEVARLRRYVRIGTE